MSKYQMWCNEDAVTKEIDAADMDAAREQAEDWMRGGEWGADGATVGVTVTPIGRDGELDRDAGEYIEVEIEPDHDALILAAGGDTDCEHDWTSDGEGGCRENPGVWSVGGTAMTFDSHCRRCGLHRHEHSTGSQRNPGEHDTVKYRMLDEDEIEAHRANGDMDEIEVAK